MATSSTFSGSAVAAGGSLNSFVNRCQVFLNDELDSTWDTEIIANFLNDAIRDYSQHFPRVKSTAINCSDDDNDYDLPADLLGVISVEYPAGEDPPAYLIRKTRTAAGWWNSDSFYDVIPHRDDGDVDELIISADPSSGETITVTYNAIHTLAADPATPTETLSVPEEHQHLLTKYVRWMAALHLASAEQQSPTSNSSLLMAQLAQNARRDEIAYSTALQQVLYAAEGRSDHLFWTQPGTGVERIY